MKPLGDRSGTWAPWAASLRFVTRLTRRHAAATASRASVARVMLRLARGAGRVAARHECLAVRVELRVRMDGNGAGGGRWSHGTVAGPPPITTYGGTRRPAASLHPTTELLVARPDPVERVTTGRRPSSPAFGPPYAGAYPPVPRVTRRGTPLDVSTPATTRDLTARRADRGGTSHTNVIPQAPQLVPLAPPELTRLTNQVVDAIDRRLVAYRERHGRI